VNCKVSQQLLHFSTPKRAQRIWNTQRISWFGYGSPRPATKPLKSEGLTVTLAVAEVLTYNDKVTELSTMQTARWTRNERTYTNDSLAMRDVRGKGMDIASYLLSDTTAEFFRPTLRKDNPVCKRMLVYDKTLNRTWSPYP
jgi:hypothetical protein